MPVGAFHQHGFVLFFPFLVPVLVGHLFVGEGDAGGVGILGQLPLEPFGVELVGGDIGFHAVGGFHKAVVWTFVAQGVYQQVAEGFDGFYFQCYFCVFHKLLIILDPMIFLCYDML